MLFGRQYSFGCRYNAVQYITILHTACNEYKSAIELTKVWVSIVKTFKRKIDRVITYSAQQQRWNLDLITNRKRRRASHLEKTSRYIIECDPVCN